MHVLIYNPLHAGHHLNWVKLMVRAIAPFATRITFATTRRGASSADYAEHLGDVSAQFTLDDSVDEVDSPPERLEGLRVARRAWLGLRGAIGADDPDRAIVAYGDHLVLAPLVTIGGERDLGMDSTRIDATFVQSGEFAYRRHLPPRRRVRALLELACLDRLPFGRLMFIDPIVHDWLAEHRPSPARRCVLLPDPVSPVDVHEKPAARAMLGLPTDGRLITCAGVLDVRKGIDEFVRSFALAPLADTDRLLLAGRASPEVVAAVRDVTPHIAEGRIISIDRILTGRELDLAVSAADLVATPYPFPRHLGSASVLIRAAAAGRPVLATDAGWLGHVTRRFSLGWLYPTRRAARPGSIAESLGGCAAYVPGRRAREFANFHAVDRFEEIVAAPFHGPSSGAFESDTADSNAARPAKARDTARGSTVFDRAVTAAATGSDQ